MEFYFTKKIATSNMTLRPYLSDNGKIIRGLWLAMKAGPYKIIQVSHDCLGLRFLRNGMRQFGQLAKTAQFIFIPLEL